MLDDLPKKLRRRRLDNVSKVLREFGLSDPGQIADTLCDSLLPSLSELERLIKSLDLRLPPNVSPNLIARALLARIDEPTPATLQWREAFGRPPNLSAIKAGPSHASRYHQTIFGTLRGIFDGVLSNGHIEQEINSGIHRVDIMFDNFSTLGFFAEVRDRLDLKSNYVPTECKNYSADLDSPEYDQLSGRLNDQLGRVGLLVFRKIGDSKKALNHQRAKWEKRELLILLDDNDIVQMHTARYEGRASDVDKLLWKKVRALQLYSTK